AAARSAQRDPRALPPGVQWRRRRRPQGLTSMRVCFVVGDVREQKPTYATVHLAVAAHRRGHDVRFVSVDDLSFLDDNNVLGTTTRVRAGDYTTPTQYAHPLPSE